jgi:hypothetical protein
MRSVTTFSTQLRTRGSRALSPGLHKRARRDAAARRAPRRAAPRDAAPSGVRARPDGRCRATNPRLRPEPTLRGFLPLCRH